MVLASIPNLPSRSRVLHSNQYLSRGLRYFLPDTRVEESLELHSSKRRFLSHFFHLLRFVFLKYAADIFKRDLCLMKTKDRPVNFLYTEPRSRPRRWQTNLLMNFCAEQKRRLRKFFHLLHSADLYTLMFWIKFCSLEAYHSHVRDTVVRFCWSSHVLWLWSSLRTKWGFARLPLV